MPATARTGGLVASVFHRDGVIPTSVSDSPNESPSTGIEQEVIEEEIVAGD